MVAEARERSTSRPCLAALLAALAPLAGCSCGCSEEPAGETPRGAPSPGSGPGPARPARGSQVAAAQLTAQEPYDSPDLGALHGTILFTGEVPERFALGAASTPECKHHPGVDQRSNEVVVEDGKLAGVFVYLKSGYDPARIPPVPAAPARLDQRGCMYVPRVVGLRLGQLLQVANGDPTTHNVNVIAKRNKSSNRSMGKEQAALECRFDRREHGIVVKCDIHPWMRATLFVEEHPWFAVSDEHGAFRIRDVPPGEYVVEAVHETLGEAAGKLVVTASRSTGFTLTID